MFSVETPPHHTRHLSSSTMDTSSLNAFVFVIMVEVLANITFGFVIMAEVLTNTVSQYAMNGISTRAVKVYILTC